MQISGRHINKSPVFFVPSMNKEPWERAWGAVKQPDGWVYPAYYPFGLWAYSDLRRLDPKLVWESEAIEHLKALQAADEAWSRALEEFKAGEPVTLPVPDDFFDALKPPFNHQRLGISRALLANRVFFLWEMGTGKTRTMVEVLRILKLRGELRQAIVICPPVVGPTWVRETALWSKGGLSAVYWDGTDESLNQAKDADILVMSYARARLEAQAAADNKRPNRLIALDYDIIIADESHSLGNWDSEQTRAVLALSVKATRRYALSGTAADNPKKLYPQLRFLSPGLIPMTWDKYQDHYLVRSKASKHIIIGFRWLNELNAKVDLVATRMKKKDCIDLPPMTFIDIPFELGVRQKARYNELVQEMQASFEPALEYSGPIPEGGVIPKDAKPLLSLPHGAARVNKLLQIISGFMLVGGDPSICDACPNVGACVPAEIKPYTKKCVVIQKAPKSAVVRDFENPKLDTFKDLLENILESDDTNKVLCWANFKEELNDIESVCKALKVGYVRVDGSTTGKIKELEEEFQTSAKCRVFIGQVKSGVGITLTAANYAIYYALPWDPTQYKQSLERNNRPGQTRNMTVYRLLSSKAHNALDSFIAEILSFKDHVAYTLVEKIACAQCPDKVRCAKERNLPFRKGCKYQAAVNRPVAKVGLV